MRCKSCGKEIPANALWCPWCGKKQAKTKKKVARRPSGTGTIVKVAGKRTRPYLALLPATYSSGEKSRKPLGYFATYTEADEALARARLEKNRDRQLLTWEDMYSSFTHSNYFSELSVDGQKSHLKSWKHLKCVSGKKVVETTKKDFEGAVQKMHSDGLGRETCLKVRNLASLLCQEAMGEKLISVNFARLVKLPKEEKKVKPPFSSSDMKKLWNLSDLGDTAADVTLLMCYTGMRPSECLGLLLEKHLFLGQYNYFRTGSKTDAGRDRIIPIPPVLLPIVFRLKGGRTTGPLVPTPSGGIWGRDNWRNRQFNPLRKTIGAEWASPYTCRHTFSNMQRRRGVDTEIMMEIMGHADYAVAAEHYNTMTDEDLVSICQSVEGLARP